MHAYLTPLPVLVAVRLIHLYVLFVLICVQLRRNLLLLPARHVPLIDVAQDDDPHAAARHRSDRRFLGTSWIWLNSVITMSLSYHTNQSICFVASFLAEPLPVICWP